MYRYTVELWTRTMRTAASQLTKEILIQSKSNAMLTVCWTPSLGNCALAKRLQRLRNVNTRVQSWTRVETRGHLCPPNASVVESLDHLTK